MNLFTDMLRPIKKLSTGLFLLSVLCAGIFSVPPVRSAHAAPVVAVVVAVVVAEVVSDVTNFQCFIDMFNGCGGGHGGSGGGGSNSGGSGNGAGGSDSDTNGGAGNGGGTGGVSDACSTPDTNACRMHGTGFWNADHTVCSAVVPPNSQCPAPGISSDAFKASPNRVRSGNTATLYWGGTGGGDDITTSAITDATECAINGGISKTGLTLSGSAVTNPILQQTNFTLTCWNGIDGPSSSMSTTVGLIPEYEER